MHFARGYPRFSSSWRSSRGQVKSSQVESGRDQSCSVRHALEDFGGSEPLGKCFEYL